MVVSALLSAGHALSAWGIAAALWIASGLGRIFFGGKETDFYWHNGLFWVKLGLFGLVFALELTPMMTFVRVRTAQRRGTAFMARGAWLF